MHKMGKVNIYHIEIILKYTDYSKLTTKDSNTNKIMNQEDEQAVYKRGNLQTNKNMNTFYKSFVVT